MKRFFATTFIVFFATFNCVRAQQLDDFKYTGSSDSFQKPTVEDDHQVNNYTTHWLNDYQKWYRYGDLFKMSVPDVRKTLLQSKIDIAADMGIPGLFLETGFVNGLLNASYISLPTPSEGELKVALESGKSVLVYVDPGTDLGRQLMNTLPIDATSWRKTLGAYQYNSPNIIQVDAFYLKNGDRKIFVIASKDASARENLGQLINRAKQVLKDFDLKKGFFGVQTLLKSVTSTEGSPLDVIGEGMNEGASWFVFDGYMDFTMKKYHELDNWLGQVESPIVTDLGTNNLFGCKDYEGFQPQMMDLIYKKETYFKYVQVHGCYAFRPVYDPSSDSYSYDGYIATDGNKEFIDTSHVPFVIQTGTLQDSNLLQSMILFVPRGETFTREVMWKAIMDRRSVGVLERGKLMGSDIYRHALDLLVLDKVFLEQYFGDGIDLETKTIGDSLHLKVKNTYNRDVKGKLIIKLPSTLKMDGSLSNELVLTAETVKEMSFKLNPTESAMNKRNPISTYFQWEHHEKGTMTELELPPAISVYRLLYGVAPSIEYPVTIHNFTSRTSYPVEISVIEKGGNHKTVYQTRQAGSAKPGHYQEMEFNLKVPPGQYEVKVSALDQNYTSQLGVGGAKIDGTGAKAYTVDLNGDGIDEYRMENDSVKVTLLTTGARIIQYIVKSQNENEFIQVWPDKPIDSLRAYRKHKYYPFGGFEDFLGQPSLETFKNYRAKIIKKSGDYVQVQMSAEYYGNTITKTFTLYGNSPLVGIRFKLNFITPSSNVIGPQPMLRFGDGRTQDIIIPTVEGIQHYRPKAIYWGKVFDLGEGWNGGYSEESNLSWVGAYPVSQPLFLHMWFNTPANPGSHYTYTELQPWIPMFQRSNWYFSYYMWGMDGSWEKSLQELRKRNLITQRE